MKMLTTLSAIALIGMSSITHATGCSDGNEPVKTVSSDGSYYEYNCGGSSSVDNSVTTINTTESGTVSLASAVQKSTSSGNWFPDNHIPKKLYSPHYLSENGSALKEKSHWSNQFAFADFNNDGSVDMFSITNPRQAGFDYEASGPNCKPELGECFSHQGAITALKVKSYPYVGTDVSHLLIDNNPIEMKGTDCTDLHVADFNGDGKVDLFCSENSNINQNFGGKNDLYFLSQADDTWLESTVTHVTGKGVRNGKGLINFSHGATIGDIDGDGDIDIIVTSIVWSNSGNGGGGEIWCYVNQGDGHMKVRQCGDQWGFTGELGDIDNDGDLDLVWSSHTQAWIREWNMWDGAGAPGCWKKSGNDKCSGSFNGILLNDGTGNFYERGFEFPEVENSNGFSYQLVPAIGLADLDGDDDLDVIRMHTGNMYAGAGMTIEENIGNGKFRTVLYSEFCASPKTKEAWPTKEGTRWNCWVSDFKFGDFNKDGLVDIYLDGHDANNSNVVQDGAIFMSTDKFKYNIVTPWDKNYPLHRIKVK